MRRNRLGQIEEIFHAAEAQEPHRRAAFLAKACGNDTALRCEVESLLALSASAFLDQPAPDLTSLSIPLKTYGQLSPGTLVGRYRIETLLGEGGMGQVFRAHDTRLGRTVAIKVVRSTSAGNTELRGRLENEAQAISALNHPSICALYDVIEQDHDIFLVMEYVDGETLAALLTRGALIPEKAVEYAIQIAGALSEAHAKHILHRDLKPDNVMITPTGVKVLDFGLAKYFGDPAALATGAHRRDETQPGQILGSPAYMSPEQISGKPVDPRSDIFALGSVLYEMLCGSRAFQGETTLAVLGAVLQKKPDDPRSIRPGIPPAIEQIVLRCLEKAPEARFSSASELSRALAVQQSSRATRIRSNSKWMTPRATAIAAALVIVLSAGIWGTGTYLNASRQRWVNKEAVPEIARLIEENRRLAALKLYHQVQKYAPASPALIAFEEGVSTDLPVTIQTTPAGAQVYISDYVAAAGDDLAQWQLLGQSPLNTNQIPKWGYYRVRAEKQGFAPRIQTFFPQAGPSANLALQAPGTIPPGMVWVPAGPAPAPAPPLPVPGFWMDASEVTNRQFKQFVDAGGYDKSDYWKEPFIQNGKRISWRQAMEEFRDATRKPGPSSWQFGAYPDGTAEMPVSGVSWYEASAYAEFAGKSLPTIYEWFRASGGSSGNSEILTLSNFGGKALARAGANRGMALFGTYDMAGNVSEWAANAAGDQRYLLGGAWNEEPYTFTNTDARDPITRGATFGFRCVQRVTSPSEESFRAIILNQALAVRSKPVDDRTFQLFADLQAYDKTGLNAKVEQIEDSSPYYRRETVTFPAAYGVERMMLHLFLPKNGEPPYQVIVVFGGIDVLSTNRVRDFPFPYEFVLRTGRAMVIPVFSGTLERGPSPYHPPINQERERALRWPKDMGQTIDYLETRPDINSQKVGFYGVSYGASHGVRLIALDHRFRAAVFSSGGLIRNAPQETDPWNYAPRVRIPVLMLNGRDDFIYPVETSQKPLFNALGTAPSDKRYIQYDGGHANLVSRPDLIGEILQWFDHYLGPVRLRQ